MPEVLEVQDVPSVDVRMVPESPTATNFTDSEVVVVVSVEVVVVPNSSESSLQEITVRLKREMRIMFNTLFIFSLHL